MGMANTHVTLFATALEISSAALVTRRFADLVAFSPSETALETSFFTGDDAERLLLKKGATRVSVDREGLLFR
jgi:hypothetical protein